MGFADIDSERTAMPSVSRALAWFGLVDGVVFWAFTGGLAWAPFWYGGHALIAWGLNALFFCGLVVVYEVSVVLPGRRHPVAIHTIAVPAALFAGVVVWIAVQDATWIPSNLANPIWGLASDAIGQKLDASISVNRDLTGLALMRLLTAASVFWLAMQLCRDGLRANRLVASIAMIGAAYAAYGLIAVKMGQLPWLDIPASDARVTSTFVNHNSYATYAGIGLIAFVALWLRVYERHAVDGGSWRFRLASFIDTTGGNGAWLLIGGFVSFVALLLTGSRGGVLSSGLGLAALGVLALCRGGRRSRRPIAAIGFLIALLIAAMFVFGSVFADKFGASGLADSNRLAVFLLTARSILDLPLLGYGYGTFSDVFPMYRDQSISIAGAWMQAHDSYIEQVQGLGVVFGGMLIAVLALLTLRCLRGAIERQENTTMPRVAVGAACLVGVHSVVDFSLQIQAVTLTFMAVLGAGVAQATSSRIDIGD